MARTRLDDEPIRIVDARCLPIVFERKDLYRAMQMESDCLLVYLIVEAAEQTGEPLSSYVRSFTDHFTQKSWKDATTKLVDARLLKRTEGE